MRYKNVSLTPGDYDTMIREGISISDTFKSAFRRGMLGHRLNLVLFLSETGGYEDYVRLISPMMLNESYENTVCFTLTNLTRYEDGSFNISNLVLRLLNVFVVVSRDKISEKALEALRDLKQNSNVKLVVDVDDDLFSITECHPEYEAYRNRLGRFKRLLGLADIVTTSTGLVAEGLAPYLSKVCSNMIIPNQLDDRIWGRPSVKAAAESEQINMLYSGTETHDEDLRVIEGAASKATQILRERFGKELSITVLGGTRLSLRGMTVRRVPDNMRAYPRYASWVIENGPFDLAIAPLSLNNPLNRAKSDLKYLEYTALGIPAIYTLIEPYRNTISTMDNGILVANNDERSWCDAMVKLASDDALRERMARRAVVDVSDNRLLSNTFNQWKNIFE